ncbi:hypothetical protein [Nocardioides sp. InS609-2]|uniref:hypothetical protein n=1 Tax=Nocardioides sp. InS609-2 TaxID=2760705 RepID=UPI0020C0FFAA|nr:hypothetical protein [Nocardioides sp. InS609-2]
MTRLLRGAWARRGTLLSLVAMTLVVVAGAVTVTRFADAAGTSPWLALPLYLLGAVAISESGRALASRRREEIGLHRLRGVRGIRLAFALLAEPLLAIVTGLLLGLVVGALTTVVVTGWWLDEAAKPLDGRAVGVAVLVALGGLVSVGVGFVGGLREPLFAQVSIAERPRHAGTTAVFLGVLVIVGAAVAAYRAGAGSAEDPDAVVLAGPALVALAAGLLTSWLVRFAAQRLAGRTATSGIAPFLAVRRLGRSADAAAPVRLLVAASVLAALTLTGSLAVASWADDSARLRVGGAQYVPLDGGALEALSVSRTLDPEGMHLMATTSNTVATQADDRRAFVDVARYDAVVGDYFDGTPAGSATAEIGGLATGLEPRVITGDSLDVGVTNLVDTDYPNGVIVSVAYVADGSTTSTAEAEIRFPAGQDGGRLGVPVNDCTQSCVIRSIRVESLFRVNYDAFDGQPAVADWESFSDPGSSLLVTELSLGENDLLDQTYVPLPGLAAPGYGALVVNRPDGLEFHGMRRGFPEVVPETGSGALPALVTPGTEAGDVIRTPGGRDRTLDVRGTVAALPFVASGGLLADLPSALVGDDPTATGAEVGIVAGPGTPDSMLAALLDETGTRPRTAESARQAVYDGSGAQQAGVYVLMAGACLLVALIALASAIGRQRSEHRAQVAALRVIGVPVGTARRAGRLELILLAVLTGAGVFLGGWVAVRFLLAHLRLVAVPAFDIPVDTAVQWWLLVGAALVAAVAVLVLGGRSRDVPDRLTRPAMLRTGAGAVRA